MESCPRGETTPAQGHAGASQLENSLAEKDLGVLMDSKLNKSQQCVLSAKKALGVHGCIRQNITGRLREGILPPAQRW